MSSSIKILILEDNDSDAELVKRELRRADLDFTSESTQDRRTFLAALSKGMPDVILADYSLPGFDGLTALTLSRQQFPDVPVIIVSGAIGEEVAIETLKAGATDYVLKQRLHRLGPVIQRALKEASELRARKRAQEDLQKSEQRWATTLASIGDAVISTDIEGRITFMNSVAQILTGWSLEEALSRVASEVFRVTNEDASDHAEDPVGRVLREGRIISLTSDTILLRRDGTEIGIDDSAAPICDGSGRVEGVVLVFRDITEHKRAEDQLRKQAALLDLAYDAIVVRGIDDSILFWNPEAERLYGWSKEEALGQTAPEFLHTEAPVPLAEIKEVLKREGHYECELRQTRRDGQVILVESRWALQRNASGLPLSILQINRDVTARRQAEQEVRRYSEQLENMVEERTAQIQKLERERLENEKQVALGRMAARIAHEINNPLAGIKNAYTLVKRSVPATSPHFRFVDAIDRELNRIARIVRQMFELYRPKHAEANEFNPADAILDVVALMEGSFRSRAVTAKTDVTRASEAVVLHEDSLRQVLFSIAQNALEASPPNAQVEIMAEIADHRLVVTVKDAGYGIPEELKSRIFEPFFTTKKGLASGGLGLGLSVTKGLVESIGGTLAFESRVGTGTTFTLSFPINRPLREDHHE